jgi:hypothetical protein
VVTITPQMLTEVRPKIHAADVPAQILVDWRKRIDYPLKQRL